MLITLKLTDYIIKVVNTTFENHFTHIDYFYNTIMVLLLTLWCMKASLYINCMIILHTLPFLRNSDFFWSMYSSGTKEKLDILFCFMFLKTQWSAIFSVTSGLRDLPRNLETFSTDPFRSWQRFVWSHVRNHEALYMDFNISLHCLAQHEMLNLNIKMSEKNKNTDFFPQGQRQRLYLQNYLSFGLWKDRKFIICSEKLENYRNK